MFISARELEEKAALDAAARIVAAVRTAPKTKGVDIIRTCVLTDEHKERLARKMEELGQELHYDFFLLDAKNLDAAAAVVLIAAQEKRAGLGEGCSYCHFAGCDACAQAGGLCAFNAMDVGIALGSAAAMAADLRVDSRIMFSIGRAAMALGLPFEGATLVVGLPISVSGKSPFFDRK